ncbi:hypothetical protein CSQ80_14670 [Cyanobacterium aponinum IPPAS B-1201]|nr:hypothetical protein CSQ80_14670 [Cyanobacterium aponinum IPPAS B-1201]
MPKFYFNFYLARGLLKQQAKFKSQKPEVFTIHHPITDNFRSNFGEIYLALVSITSVRFKNIG